MRYFAVLFFVAVMAGCIGDGAPAVNTNPTVEAISGMTGDHNAGSFDLATGADVTFVQVWCLADGAWYQADIRITDGLVAFQCESATEWSARIVH